MAQSFVQYAADGRDYSVPFQYINKSHVKATIAGTEAPFAWVSENLLRLDATPPTGSVIEIARHTPNDIRLVDFVDGSLLGEADLDLSALQLLFIAQEAADRAGRALGLTPQGTFDARGLEIINVADPRTPQSAVTRKWTEDTLKTSLEEAAGKVVFVFVEKENPFYIHSQIGASLTWNVVHNLDTYPKPTIYNSSGEFIVAEYRFVDRNTLVITFSTPTVGVAYVS